MSCDFGPIPLPTSPLQSYWEERMQSQSSTTNPSRSAPVAKSEQKDNNIIPQLHEALEKLVEEQERNDGADKAERDHEVPPLAVRRQRATHHRAQSFGQRLLSGGMEWWSNLGAEPSTGVQKMKQS